MWVLIKIKAKLGEIFTIPLFDRCIYLAHNHKGQ